MATISIQCGSEGPRHDPYSYAEITVTRDSRLFAGEVTFHGGLGEWVEFRPKGRPEVYRCDGASAARLFTLASGVSPGLAERYAQEYRERRIASHPCGQKHLQWVDGFPGETLLHCSCLRHVYRRPLRPIRHRVAFPRRKEPASARLFPPGNAPRNRGHQQP